MTRTAIIQLMNLSSGGGITKMLNALEESGFIHQFIPYGKKSNQGLYKLVDEYYLFYLTWIKKTPRAVFESGVNTVESAWFYYPLNKLSKGVQFDLVIDRSDQCINLCEIKFTTPQFSIDKSYAEELRYKRDTFNQVTLPVDNSTNIEVDWVRITK